MSPSNMWCEGRTKYFKEAASKALLGCSLACNRLVIEQKRGRVDQYPSQVLSGGQSFVVELLLARFYDAAKFDKLLVVLHRLLGLRELISQLLQFRINRQRFLGLGDGSQPGLISRFLFFVVIEQLLRLLFTTFVLRDRENLLDVLWQPE